MSYPKSLKERARQLANDGLSAEAIAEVFSKEFEKGEHDYDPTPRTIRYWLSESTKEQKELTAEEVSLARGHDGEIFKKSDDIMSEMDLRDVVSKLLSGNAMHINMSTKLGHFLWFFSLESNQYISSGLRNECSQFLDSLTELGTFTDANFYSSETIRDTSELWITMPSRYRVSMGEEGWQEYHQLETELHRLAKNAYEAYKSYRAAVRQTLNI